MTELGTFLVRAIIPQCDKIFQLNKAPSLKLTKSEIKKQLKRKNKKIKKDTKLIQNKKKNIFVHILLFQKERFHLLPPAGHITLA